MTKNQRVVAWFSCGAASAVAAYHTVLRHPDTTEIVYCDTMATEHPDNLRFFNDVQRWLDRPIRRITSTKFSDIDDVFDKTRYMAGIAGARCTTEMKKIPRFAYQRADDVHVFGFTSDEGQRIRRFEENNPDLLTEFVLAEENVTKQDCYDLLEAEGIELPEMYRLGYKNNNCLGCVKATSARYWNMTRRDFPEVFERRVRQSRELGVRLTRVRGKRVFLDELPADYIPAGPLEDISCGPDCNVTDGGDQ